ncbi:hypothetical protein ACP70R_048041 [Stipagrostis hirtigluma subsp. patula]
MGRSTSSGGKTGDPNRAEWAAGVGKDGKPQGFNWAGFLSNRLVILQFFLYALMFYKTVPSPHDIGPLLLWLLLLSICVLNMVGTHILAELTARREKQQQRQQGRLVSSKLA